MKEIKPDKGFTLVEILTVVTIFGMLFFIFIPQVNSAFLKSNETSIYTDFRTFQQSSESYFRETLGINLQVSSLNIFMDEAHKVLDLGTIKHTKSKDPWKNPYEVTLETGKITFSSYGKNENPAVKVYNLVTYSYKGEVSSCTTGLGVRNIQLSFDDLDPFFVCGDDIEKVPSTPGGSLSAPSNFVASNITQTKIELSWNAVSGATSYVLKRGNTIIYTGSNRTFSDITLVADTTYTYSVAAKNGSDVSSYATLSVKTNSGSELPLFAPSNFVANQLTDVSVSLSWGGSYGATSYELKRDGITIYTGSNLLYLDTGLSPSTTYTYSLVAKNASSTSSSRTLTIKTYTAPVLAETIDPDFNGVSVLTLTDQGSLVVWGSNGIGQLGIGVVGSNTLPTTVGNDTDWLRLFPSDRSSFALKTNGTLWAWGYNAYGHLGLGDKVNRLVPTQVGTGTNWKEIIPGDDHVLGIKTDGTLWAWGLNNVGQLGTNDSTTLHQVSPKQVGTETNWKSVYTSAGGAVFAIKTNGTLWSWGLNYQGELGLGDTNYRTFPHQVGTDTNWKEVIYTDKSVAAIKTDGTLWTWGEGKYGKLGHGDTANKLVPTKVGTDTQWKSVFSDGYLTAAIKTDGTLWTWGYGGVYQLGHGIDTNLSVPTKVGTDNNWKDITICYDVMIGLKTDGTIWSWGRGEYGENGQGNADVQKTPKKIGNDADWRSVNAMDKSVIAVKNNGTVWGWGRNLYSQLGFTTEGDQMVATPKQVFVQ